MNLLLPVYVLPVVICLHIGLLCAKYRLLTYLFDFSCSFTSSFDDQNRPGFLTDHRDTLPVIFSDYC